MTGRALCVIAQDAVMDRKGCCFVLQHPMCNVVELQVCRVRKEATRMGCKSPRSLHRNRKVPKWHPTTGTGLVLLA